MIETMEMLINFFFARCLSKLECLSPERVFHLGRDSMSRVSEGEKKRHTETEGDGDRE